MVIHSLPICFLHSSISMPGRRMSSVNSRVIFECFMPSYARPTSSARMSGYSIFLATEWYNWKTSSSKTLEHWRNFAASFSLLNSIFDFPHGDEKAVCNGLPSTKQHIES